VEKFLALGRRAPHLTRQAFFDEFVARAAPLVVAAPQVSRYVVNLVDVPAEDVGLRPGGEPAFDVVAETWVDSIGDFLAVMASVSLQTQDLIQSAPAYQVSEHLERDYDRDWPAGERSPGIKSFYLAKRRDDFSHEAFAHHWGANHAPLALRHHVGMWRYVRNVVTGPMTPGAPDWDGMAALHFRTSADFRERFYDSDEGRRIIAADIASFTTGGRALHTSEYIVKG